MTVIDTVKEILEKYPESRESDKVMIFMVWSKAIYGTPTGYDQIVVDINTAFQLPNTETIRRSRQELMAKFPHLQGSEYIRRMRKKYEKNKGTHIFREEMPSEPIRLIDYKDVPVKGW